MKNASCIFSSISNKPITLAPNNPPASPIKSHGNLALVICQILSEDSTSSVIPEAHLIIFLSFHLLQHPLHHQ